MLKRYILVVLVSLCWALPARADDTFLPMVSGGGSISNALPRCTPEFIAAANELPTEVSSVKVFRLAR